MIGLRDINSTLTSIDTTSALLTTQQSDLNATLANISGNAGRDIDNCTSANCTALSTSLVALSAGPAYSVR